MFRKLLGFLILGLLFIGLQLYGDKLEALPFFWQALISVPLTASCIFVARLFILPSQS